ncbi:hypothetical protein EDD21DRAFT_370053 [Dissophora ornata]|nr:hypothetical protein EDD21DRAFT_370053 [Dissophora ornata]
MKLITLSIFAAFLSLQICCSANEADCPEGRVACADNCRSGCGGSWEDGGIGCLAACSGDCKSRCGTFIGGCYKSYCWAECASGFPFVTGE